MAFEKNVLPYDGEAYLIQSFLDEETAQSMEPNLDREVEWQHQKIKVYGKLILQPRLSAWYGDEGVTYTYSNLEMKAKTWTPILSKLRAQIESEIGQNFNSVLVNKYRNGEDSMGAHRDDEAELGVEPVIASLSLGGTRDFVFKHLKTKEKIVIPLHAGSLLVMKGRTQELWTHALPKRRREKRSRINLTFRWVEA